MTGAGGWIRTSEALSKGFAFLSDLSRPDLSRPDLSHPDLNVLWVCPLPLRPQ